MWYREENQRQSKQYKAKCESTNIYVIELNQTLAMDKEFEAKLNMMK